MACQTTGPTQGGTGFVPDSPSSASASRPPMSYEQQIQQKELEGFVSQYSARRYMRLPKDYDMTLSGARAHSTKVEFQDVEEDYSDHSYRSRLFMNTSASNNYRPAFNSNFGSSYFRDGRN